MYQSFWNTSFVALSLPWSPHQNHAPLASCSGRNRIVTPSLSMRCILVAMRSMSWITVSYSFVPGVTALTWLKLVISLV